MGRVLGVLAGVVAGIAFSGTSLPAQSQASRPDFSGTWTLAPAPGVRPDAPLWNEGVITQDASIVTITGSDPGRASYRLDGTDTDSTITTVRGDTWALTSQTKWVEKALVITTTYNTPIGRWQDFTTLSLDEAGNLRMVTDKTPKQENVPRVVTQYTYKRK
jgi:hypothetical protein